MIAEILSRAPSPPFPFGIFAPFLVDSALLASLLTRGPKA